MKNQGVLEAVSKLFGPAENILLTAAENFDGDALGCVLALEAYARSKGKRVTIANSRPVSSLYEFLGISHRVETKIPSEEYDLIIVCDTGDVSMIGRLYEENRKIFETTPLVNIDHHGSCYGNVCWMDPTYTAACDMVAEFIEYDGGFESITAEMATFLLLGILYDTGCYRNTNTLASTFERSARLLHRGADYMGLIRGLYQDTSIACAKLYGEGLANPYVLAEGRAVGAFLSNESFKRNDIDANAFGNEFVNDYLRSVRASFVFFIKEMPDGEKRISFRSKKSEVDVRIIAERLGG